MSKALQPPERTHRRVALESAGVVFGRGWARPFYAHLDAFLSASRSVPELIRCCFGIDLGGRTTKDWFDALDPDEQKRRREFGDKFKQHYAALRALPLGTARHIGEHRTGFPPVTVTVAGRLGIIYEGSPIKAIPTSETRELPPEYAWMSRPIPVEAPNWKDFDIDGRPLFETCRDYLDRAGTVISQARALAE